MTKIETDTTLIEKPGALTEAAKNFLAAIVATSDDAIISKDLNGIIRSWNEGARRIFGYEADEAINQSILLVIPEELRHEEDFILSKIRAGERIEHFETTRVRKNGERFPISVTISPIKDDRGKIIGASKIARDITERRLADESRFRLAAIVDSAEDAIVSKNLDGIITSWNNGARRLFGYRADEIVGKSIRLLIPDDLQHEEDEILRKIRAGEKIEHYETTRVTKSGEMRDVSVTISPIRNRNGIVIGASKIARDISDRKKVERLAVQAEKIATTGRMAAAIAHEINNPLASVLNLIYLARQEGASKKEIENYLAMAESELARVSHIARRTLGYYRESGSPSEVHLQDLMENVLSLYRNRLLNNNVVVQAEFADLRKICVHSGEIVQVFSNVVANALDAMPQGGRLSISTLLNAEQDGVQVVVKDTGHGIPPQHLDRIFEPFFTTRGTLGTGIGLWIARQIVQQHGGRISVASSTTPGDSGATVTIDLPFSGPQTTARQNNQPASPNENQR